MLWPIGIPEVNHTNLQRSRAKSRLQSRTKREAVSLQELKAEAGRCHTPGQFGELLQNLRTLIPYEKFAGIWGHPSQIIRFMFYHDIPIDLIRWRLTTGALWTSPIFKEWLETNRSVLWCDAVKRLRADFDPELLLRMEKAGLQYMLCGGSASKERFVMFAAAMPSEESGRAHLEQFDSVVSFLVEASQRAYPRALLTQRETAILERRAKGEITKQIAAAERISERTVREHLHNIKKKLYTDDIVNAVVIAVKGGIVLPHWKKGMKGDSPRAKQSV
jgi:DNA-binding CsgD family transcriptional regulator